MTIHEYLNIVISESYALIIPFSFKSIRVFLNRPDLLYFVPRNDMNFPGGSDGEESACNARDPGSTPGWGRSSGEKNGCPLQYSHLENFMDSRAPQAIIHRITKSRTRLRISHSYS